MYAVHNRELWVTIKFINSFLIYDSSSFLSILLKLQGVVCVDWLKQCVAQHRFLFDRDYFWAQWSELKQMCFRWILLVYIHSRLLNNCELWPCDNSLVTPDVAKCFPLNKIYTCLTIFTLPFCVLHLSLYLCPCGVYSYCQRRSYTASSTCSMN